MNLKKARAAPPTLCAAFERRATMSDIILIVDDERILADTIAFNLRKEGFEVVVTHDGESALALTRTLAPRLVILDLMLPKVSGWEVCRALRQSPEYQTDAPILMLTARGEEADKVLGLEMGADDYLVKPFGMRELVARVRALLRRQAKVAPPDEGVMRAGPVEMNVAKHEVRLYLPGGGSREVALSLKEFELLRVLLLSAGNTVQREVLLQKVWGSEFYGDERTLDVHIRWLREKLENTPSQPEYLQTVRGVGYKFRA